MKVAFDIGGVISRYPECMRWLIAALIRGGAQVYVLTDMKKEDALAALRENQLIHLFAEDHVLSADWSDHGDLCKSVVCEREGIRVLIDDRPDYLAHGDFIGLALSPRPRVPYYHPTWINRSTPAVCVPPEEYEDFKAWRQSRRAGEVQHEAEA